MQCHAGPKSKPALNGLKMIGICTMYNRKKGYGFITVDGTQYFFHVSNFTVGEMPAVGAFMHFILGPPVRGGSRLQALSVRYAWVEELNKAKVAGANALSGGL
jgi:hypothetical protein